jgi:LacI family transcriptional regulator
MAKSKDRIPSGVLPAADFVRPPAVTIHDVARLANVSAMTVSRVINDHKYVSSATSEKVHAAIAKLNYSPNLAARGLHGLVRIGMLYSNPSSSNLGEFLMSAFREAGQIGCQLLIEPTLAHPSGTAAVMKLVDAGVDGVILPPPLCDSTEVLDALRNAGVAALCFATAEPHANASAVTIDDFEGGRLMTQHLLALGHRDIGFVRGDPTHSTARRREAGFRAAMSEANVAVHPEWVAQGYFSYRSGLDAARALLEQRHRPSAIFASNDDMAAAIASVAHGLGLSLPQELSIAGFDDAPVALTVWPELTTVHQPIAEMAAAAVALIADQVRRTRAGEDVIVRHRLVGFTLVERASTAPLAATDKP